MSEHAAVVLADMLCAAADDCEVPLTRHAASRLAERTLELLGVAGYGLVRADEWNEQ